MKKKIIKRIISLTELTPELLEAIRNKTNNQICGITIPKFNFNPEIRLQYKLNFCEDMTFINALNISGKCGKIEDIAFPYSPRSSDYEPEKAYMYDIKCPKCLPCCCPPILRDKCIEKNKVIKKKKIPIRKDE